MVLIFMSMFGVMFLVTQYLQLVRGYSPLGAAIRLLPNAPIMILIAPMTPRLSVRFGANKTVAAGMVLRRHAALHAAAHARPSTRRSRSSSARSCSSTAGFALAMSPMTASIMSAVPPRRAGAGSAMNDASRELGAALGVAVMGSLAASKYSDGRRPAHGRPPRTPARRGPGLHRRRGARHPAHCPDPSGGSCARRPTLRS